MPRLLRTPITPHAERANNANYAAAVVASRARRPSPSFRMRRATHFVPASMPGSLSSRSGASTTPAAATPPSRSTRRRAHSRNWSGRTSSFRPTRVTVVPFARRSRRVFRRGALRVLIVETGGRNFTDGEVISMTAPRIPGLKRSSIANMRHTVVTRADPLRRSRDSAAELLLDVALHSLGRGRGRWLRRVELTLERSRRDVVIWREAEAV